MYIFCTIFGINYKYKIMFKIAYQLRNLTFSSNVKIL